MKLLLLLLSFALFLFASPIAAQESPTSLCSRAEYERAIEAFNRLSAEEQKNPPAMYVAGYSYLRRHEFLKAEPLLLAAQQSGFHGFPRWTPIDVLIARVQTMKKLCPPLRARYEEGGSTFEVYGPDDDWCRSIYPLIPDFLKRARQCFGDSLPPINFYFFDKRATYEAFYAPMFEKDWQRSWQAGTGNFNVVVFCEYLPDGKRFGENDLEFRRGSILHELGHALCGTICGDCYFRQVPDWLTEGLADMVAQPYLGRLFATSQYTLSRSAAHKPAPTYDHMCHALYSDPTPGYALGRLFTARLLDKQGPDAVGKIIRLAKQNNCDFEWAIRQVTGNDPKATFAEVEHNLWKASVIR